VKAFLIAIRSADLIREASGFLADAFYLEICIASAHIRVHILLLKRNIFSKQSSGAAANEIKM
jgi:hypothetical protein